MIIPGKIWLILIPVYFAGYLITYCIATIIDKEDREKEKEEYGDDFFDTSREGRRENRIVMAALWPISIICIIVAGLFELIFSGSAKICDKIIQKKEKNDEK